jgi:structure-specific recognition protein 1
VVETTVNLSDEELSRRFDDKLDAVESGDLPAVVAKVFSAFCKRKVQMIKNREGGFNSHIDDDKAKSLRCSLKTNDGFLFPLDKSFFFIANKPVMVEFERISSIEFNRVDKSSGSASRTFDITVHVKDGSGPHQFVNLQRSDYKELFRFLTAKKIRIKNIRAASDRAADFDDDDDGFAEDDPYMARMKREREEAAADDDDDDDDDGSSEDDDFRPGGESDVDEEYDEGDDAGSEAGGRRGGGGSESDGSEAPRAKKEKRGKKERKEGEGTPKKAKRVKKDKDAPKRGMSGYMLFMNGNRERFKEQNPGCKVTDIGRFAGAEWKEMDKEAREPWEEKARADKARYEREQAEYLEAHPEAAPQPKQKKERAPKAPKAPKPPKAPKAKAAAAPTYAHEDTSSSEEE